MIRCPRTGIHQLDNLHTIGIRFTHNLIERDMVMNPEIYRTVKDRILYLEYRPGQILNENALAKEFGVSRTPMREVLTRLEWEQLARVIPRTGTMVTEIEFQKMMNAYQARLEIDGLVARLAAENATPQHLDRLREIRERCLGLVDTQPPKDLVRIDFEFRNTLHEAADNPILADIAQTLYDLTLRLWVIVLDKGGWAEEVTAIADEIDSIAAIFETNDSAGAEKIRQACLMRHLERIRVKFLGISGGSPVRG